LDIDGRGFRVAGGQGCVIAPGARHDFESPRGSLCLVLDSSDVQWAGWAHTPPQQLPTGVQALARYLATASTQQTPHAQAHGPALLLEAWSQAAALRRANTTPRARPPRRVIDWPTLQRWASQRWHGDLGVADLARQVHLSPNQFTARCVEEQGVNAATWLRSLRLDHARALQDSGASVAEAARRAGYRSPSALTAALKKNHR
jgi:AraC-like DNA-binding protein